MRVPCWILSLLFIVLAGCTTTQTKRAEGLAKDVHLGQGKSLVILEADIELSELLASGITEVRVDWTEAATGFVNNEIREHLQASQVRLIPYRAPSEPKRVARIKQLELLSQAVSYSILAHEFSPYARLRSKEGRFDWTIGPGAREMREEFGADFAMVTLIRDSYATGGRKALMVAGLVGAVFGVGVNVSLGQRIGYSTLIDLATGKVVWSNLMASETGDLRNPEDAEKAIKALLKDLPL